MFDYDKWQEIFATIRKNWLRSLLTMFGVFWGMFMLVIMLGGGTGLRNGVESDFDGWASNSGFIWGNRTTKPYQGLQPGRYVQFDLQDIEIIKSQVDGLEFFAPRDQLGGYQGGNNVVYKTKSGNFEIYGDYPDIFNIRKVDLAEGRIINPLDLKENRKVIVIGRRVADVLFQEELNRKESLIGKNVKIQGINFSVIGVFDSKLQSNDAEGHNSSIFIPFTTFVKSYRNGHWSGWFSYSSKAGIDSDDVEAQIKEILKSRHKVHPEDNNAIGSYNLGKEFAKLQGLFNSIDIFNWLVSLGTLFAALIGISNIMLIVVKERTSEIGIRKAIGAMPMSIISMVILESVFLTIIAGGVGITLAQSILYGLRMNLPNEGMFTNPNVSIETTLYALGILVLGGAIAGLLPAVKAARVSPIEAIRAE